MTAACALVLAVSLSASPDRIPVSQDPIHSGSIAAAVAAVRAPDGTVEPWMLDKTTGRPGVLGMMYGTLGALQVLDVYSTYQSLDAGGTEINSVVRKATGNPAAMIAVKAASTAASVYFAEKAWKSNRKGAIVLMAVVNAVTAAVVANNLRLAQRRR